MTPQEIAEAATAAAYFQRKGRLLDAADTLETLAALVDGTATTRQRHAMQFMAEDWRTELLTANGEG